MCPPNTQNNYGTASGGTYSMRGNYAQEDALQRLRTLLVKTTEEGGRYAAQEARQAGAAQLRWTPGGLPQIPTGTSGDTQQAPDQTHSASAARTPKPPKGHPIIRKPGLAPRNPGLNDPPLSIYPGRGDRYGLLP